MIDFEGASRWTFCMYICVWHWSWRMATCSLKNGVDRFWQDVWGRMPACKLMRVELWTLLSTIYVAKQLTPWLL